MQWHNDINPLTNFATFEAFHEDKEKRFSNIPVSRYKLGTICQNTLFDDVVLLRSSNGGA